jgi:hypothetical protein
MARRSPYRSFPLRLIKDSRFRLLSLEAKGLLLTLALHAELTGLKRFSPGVLKIEANAASQDQLEGLLDELERANWIVIDGDAVFISDLLSWSPNYSSANENHRPGVEDSVEGILSPALIEAFWNRYPEWRSDSLTAPASPPGPNMNAMADGMRMGSRRASDSNPIPSTSRRDPEAASGCSSNTKIDNSNEIGPDGAEYARAMARQLSDALTQNPFVTAKLKPVKPDAAAAVELINAGVPLSFALEIASSVGADFRPDPVAEQILSTRYVNKAIVERWHLVRSSDRVLPLKTGARQRNFRDDLQAAADQASNRNPAVIAAVKAHMARLETESPGAGERWLDDLRARKPAERYLYPFAFDVIKAHAASTIGADRETRRA